MTTAYPRVLRGQEKQQQQTDPHGKDKKKK